jgi:hypothetical protein
MVHNYPIKQHDSSAVRCPATTGIYRYRNRTHAGKYVFCVWRKPRPTARSEWPPHQ